MGWSGFKLKMIYIYIHNYIYLLLYIDKSYPRNLAWKLIADHGSMGFTISQSFHFPPSSSFCLSFCMTRRMVSQSLGTMWWNFPGMELRNMLENTYISIIMYSHVMVVQSSVDVGEILRLMLNSHYFLMFSVQILVEFLHDKFYGSVIITKNTVNIFMKTYIPSLITPGDQHRTGWCFQAVPKVKSYLHRNQLQTFCLTATRLIQVITLNTSTWY